MAHTYTEYANIPGLTTRPILDEYPIPGRGTYRLYHCPAGYYPAGSMVRVTDHETYLSTFEDDITGTSHGQHFHTRAEAERHYLARLGWSCRAGHITDSAETHAIARDCWDAGILCECPQCGHSTATHCPCADADEDGYRGEL